jgi:mannose-1-phosphate guanylyltransferase
MKHFHVCVMAGGSGERFWPLSRKAVPKHLLRLFSDRPLVEETVRRVSAIVPPEQIFILTNPAQLEATRKAVPELPSHQIIAEPAKRDTAPACTLGTAMIRARDPEAVIAFLPADALIKDVDTFSRQFGEAVTFAAKSDALFTFGIKPTYPATGFGYLELGEALAQPGTKTRFHAVNRFVEKPDETTAKNYLQSGNYAWNAGMFLWKSDAFLREARRLQPVLADFIEQFPKEPAAADSYIRDKFPLLPRISVDYAIMEKASPVIAARAEFDWDDVGSWTSLPNHLPADAQSNLIHGEAIIHNSSNNIVFSQKRLIALCGVKDLIVVETEDAILVCHRDEAQNIKKIYSRLPEPLQ